MAVINDESLDQLTRLLVETAHPEKIILFGSHARKSSDRGSDLDVLVILPEGTDRHAEAIRLQEALAPLGLPIDLLVYSSRDVAERGHIWGTALYEALKGGELLHGTP